MVFPGLSNFAIFAAQRNNSFAKHAVAIELLNTPNSDVLRDGLAIFGEPVELFEDKLNLKLPGGSVYERPRTAGLGADGVLKEPNANGRVRARGVAVRTHIEQRMR
jgi:hypothetical protein